jgi:hypothetical protein
MIGCAKGEAAPMRRLMSIILFLVGGFCVGMQVMIGFMAIPPDPGGKLPPLVTFTALAVPFLAIATWLSPGDRMRELGLTVLIGAAVCVGSFSITIFTPNEQGVVPGMGSLTPYVDTGQGLANLAVIAILGFLLYFSKWWRPA